MTSEYIEAVVGLSGVKLAPSKPSKSHVDTEKNKAYISYLK